MSTITRPRPKTKPNDIPKVRPQTEPVPRRHVVNPVIPEEWITPEEKPKPTPNADPAGPPNKPPPKKPTKFD